MTKKRLQSLSLNDFATSPTEAPATQNGQSSGSKAPKVKKASKAKKKEQKSALNISIDRKLQRWLRDTAEDCRRNKAAPQAGEERVYPVHLIEVAIKLLQAQEIDWDDVSTIQQIEEKLGL